MSRGVYGGSPLRFVRCPPMYCCSRNSGKACKGYDYCAQNRTGILCGVCKKGYSVSILTGICHPDDKCGKDHWFWLVAFLGTVAYALWYTFLGHIFEPIFNIFSIKSCRKLNKVSNNKVGDTDSRLETNAPASVDSSNNPSLSHQFIYESHSQYSEAIEIYELASTSKQPGPMTDSKILKTVKADKVQSSKTKPNLNKGYFGIFNNFIQMSAAMNVQIEYSVGNSKKTMLDLLIEIIHTFVTLRIQRISIQICPIKGLTSLGRHMYNFAFTLGIYTSWLLIFLSAVFLSNFIAQMASFCKYNGTNISLEPLKQKLIKGLVRIMKFTYTSLCGIIFTSIICVSYGSRKVWWYDASNVCLETWQIYMIIFGVLYAIPFPFVLFVGMKLLSLKRIGAGLFVAFCLCPGAALCYILVRKVAGPKILVKDDISESGAANSILSVLQGPYRKDNQSMAIYWEAMVFLRRLLTTVMKLIGLEFVQMLILTGLWIIFLLQHVHIAPFEVRSSNHVETLSLTLLVMVAMINLLKAFLADSGLILSGPTVPIVQGLEFAEKISAIILLLYITFTEINYRRRQKRSG